MNAPDIFNKSIVSGRQKISVMFNKADDSPAQISITQEIAQDKDPWTGSGVSFEDVRNAVLEVTPQGRTLEFLINSPGGEVPQGTAIRNYLTQYPGRILETIIGRAASTASWFIPADEVRAFNSSQIFIHKSWSAMTIAGNADDFRSAVNDITKFLDTADDQISELYAEKTKKPKAEMLDLMANNTLLTGRRALELGFVDTILDGNPVSNFSDFEMGSMMTHLAALNSLRTISAPKSGADSTATNQTTQTMSTTATAGNPPAASTDTNRIAELENKLKLEREARITSAFNTIAATRPTLNREEWLPKCLNDESVLQLAQKFPESPVGGGLAFNRVELGGNPLVDKYNNLAHDKVEQGRLARGLYNDLRKQLMIANGVKDLPRVYDMFDFKDARVMNANTVDSALANTLLSADFITTMRSYIAPWNAFTRKVEFSPVSKRQTIEVQLASSAGSKQQNATNYETGDSVLAPVAVVAAEESKSFHVSRPEQNLGLALAALVPTNAKVLAEGIHAKMTALMTNANFGADVVIGAATDFDSADLRAVLALGKNYDSVRLLLDGGHLAYLLPTSRESFVFGEPGAYGFDGGIYKNNLWTSAATDICGLVCGPDAIVNGWGMAEGLPSGEAISQSTVDVNGIPFGLSVWFSRASRAVWASFQVMHGCAVGDATQAEVLTTQ